MDSPNRSSREFNFVGNVNILNLLNLMRQNMEIQKLRRHTIKTEKDLL
jgi:hypothetical protein